MLKLSVLVVDTIREDGEVRLRPDEVIPQRQEFCAVCSGLATGLVCSECHQDAVVAECKRQRLDERKECAKLAKQWAESEVVQALAAAILSRG